MYLKYLLIIYSIYLLVMSLRMLILFKKDKIYATKNRIRIKEKTLLLGTILGGSIGSFLGRILFHHKTDKFYFSLVILLNIICQITLFIILFLEVTLI